VLAQPDWYTKRLPGFASMVDELKAAKK